ncbi:MAG: Asp-tRNA(Asn)/Glu-tRNA(Gln) amidotransferase subunit GatA [Chloroflexota bacterium]|nr:MAG: Asp-tRNA(Asn)/Glu-tRNA(Gln) amidotransferase subunit GatA [Chloroflexota bacterium]
MADLLASRAITPTELAEAALARIAETDGAIHAFLHVDADGALRQAHEADERIDRGECRSRLDGIPVALKDNISTRDQPTTCGSRILEGYLPPYDATVTRRLHAAGAVIVGKTNLDEFAMGSSTEFSAFGPTRNPRDVSRVPGGSSGGSGAAVASGQVPIAFGSDTGGSVRLPASFCGVVGLKPTYGRVSRYGLVAYGSSLDQIGPLARTVEDCATALTAIAGHDPHDATTLPGPVPTFERASESRLDGLRIGVPREYFGEGIDAGVAASIERSIDRLHRLGASIHDVSLPHTRYALAAYYVIAPAEASANLARYDGVKYGLSQRGGRDLWTMVSESRAAGFGPEVLRRIMIGTYALSSGYYDAYYVKAQKVRSLVRADFDTVFESVDLLATPTCPTVAFRFGERTSDPYSMYLADVLTVTLNCAGLPGLVVPADEVDRLPVGLQLIGPALGEPLLFRVADALERMA